jgi:hypothetical protein
MIVELGKVSQQTKGPTGKFPEFPAFPNTGPQP